MHSNVISNWKGFPNGLGLSSTATFNTCTLAIPVSSETPRPKIQMWRRWTSRPSRQVQSNFKREFQLKRNFCFPENPNITQQRLGYRKYVTVFFFDVVRWTEAFVWIYCHLVEGVRYIHVERRYMCIIGQKHSCAKFRGCICRGAFD